MLSNRDYDYRARQDLEGDDKYRYENDMMNDRELRDLEVKYYSDDLDRYREEEERYWEERYREDEERYWEEEARRNREDDSSNSSSSYIGSYYDGSAERSARRYANMASHIRKSDDCLQQAMYYRDIARDTSLPQKTREEALKKCKMYCKESRKSSKRSVKEAKKNYREVSKHSGGGWVVVILVILLIIFFSS